MGYGAKVLADSIADGVRLTTMQVTFPRMVLAEFNTHRVFSRNSASSRAIPVEKNIARVRADPFVPEAFAKNQPGMQAGADFDAAENEEIRQRWLRLAEHLASEAEWFASRKVHKQWANRIPELVNWHTCIVTATEWENFYALRCNPMAAPEIRTVAEMMRAAMKASTPEVLAPGGWHLPMVQDDELSLPDVHLVKVSVARCARVSYLTHDGKRDVGADLALYDRLKTSGHMSPFEHAAKVMSGAEVYDHMGGAVGGSQFVGNFRIPWSQHRKQIVGEDVFEGES